MEVGVVDGHQVLVTFMQSSLQLSTAFKKNWHDLSLTLVFFSLP